MTAKRQLNWSPQQIVAWLKKESPAEEGNQLPHQTIYRSLFAPASGVLKKELLQHLRTQRVIRRSKHSSRKRDGLGQISNAVSILLDKQGAFSRFEILRWDGFYLCLVIAGQVGDSR